MSLFRSRNFSSISTLSTLPTTAIIANCFRHFLRIIKFRKGKKHRLIWICERPFNWGLERSPPGAAWKPGNFVDQKKMCFVSLLVIGYRDLGAGRFNHMRRRSCFAARVRVIFKRYFLKTNFCPKYSHKNSHNSNNFCSIDTKFGTTTEK